MMTDKLAEIRARLKAFGNEYTFVARHCDEPDNDKDITRDVEDLLACIDQHCQQPVEQEETVEQLAALAHEQWSNWMCYLFGKCFKTQNGNLAMLNDDVDRWTRQAQAAYSDLPENEKESDRVEARKVLSLATTAERDRIVKLVKAIAEDARKILDVSGADLAFRNGRIHAANEILAAIESTVSGETNAVTD